MSHQSSSSIRIYNDENNPVFQLKELNGKNNFILKKQNEIQYSNISSIVEHLPSMGMNIKHSQSYIATFSKMGNIMKTEKGELKAVLTKNGKTTEIAKLSKGMNLATLSTFAFQVANIIASQKHLADISEKLELISKDVKDIQIFLNNERKSKILGNLDSLKDIKYYIETKKNDNEDNIYKNQIENIERETQQIIYHLSSDLRSLFSEYNNDEIKRVENNSKLDIDYLEKQKNKFHLLIEEYMLVMSERVIANEIKLIFNNTDDVAINRLEKLSKEITDSQYVIDNIIRLLYNNYTQFKNEELKDNNSSSGKGALIGGFIGVIGGPWGVALGATMGAGIGAESEEEKKKRLSAVSNYCINISNDFKSYTNWIPKLQQKINTLKRNREEKYIQLLLTTDNNGNISTSHIINERVLVKY